MAFTIKPKNSPTFDAAAFVKNLPVSDSVKAQFINFSRWVRSTGNYAGAEAGGLKDVLKADAFAVDALKGDVDKQGTKLADHETRLAALEEQPSGPFPAFPGSG
jgi:hypothetical protein